MVQIKKQLLNLLIVKLKHIKENHILPCIKHFPGDGVDMRDQHLLSSVNDLTVDKWNNSYGKIYQHFINNGIVQSWSAYLNYLIILKK